MTAHDNDLLARPMIEGLLAVYAKNLDYAARLVADLPEQTLADQPGPGMNHPAWVLGHLACTCDVVMKAMGRPTVSPAGWLTWASARVHPVADRALYPSKAQLLEGLRQCHEKVAAAVRELTAEQLAGPPVDERFRKRWPMLSEVLVHVLIGHEQMHLGQLSAWRRVQGLPAV